MCIRDSNWTISSSETITTTPMKSSPTLAIIRTAATCSNFTKRALSKVWNCLLYTSRRPRRHPPPECGNRCHHPQSGSPDICQHCAGPVSYTHLPLFFLMWCLFYFYRHIAPYIFFAIWIGCGALTFQMCIRDRYLPLPKRLSRQTSS